MIVVDELFTCGPPWRGSQSCHLLSDRSVIELLDFARRVRLPSTWLQRDGGLPHFDLSPSWRTRAIAAGAVPVDRRGFVAAMHRYREANPR